MEWMAIEGFPNYIVNKAGEVMNTQTRELRNSSRTQAGAAKVTLFKDGRPATRSLALLVAKAHLYNDYDPEIFDTPIHLDNDPLNNHVDNLMWRPRWFAVKYNQQYWKENYRYATTKVQDVRTGEIYDGFIGVCQKYGLLYIDIIESCTRGTDVFPTRKRFLFV